jgi:hypothetical protein
MHLPWESQRVFGMILLGPWELRTMRYEDFFHGNDNIMHEKEKKSSSFS